MRHIFLLIIGLLSICCFNGCSFFQFYPSLDEATQVYFDNESKKIIDLCHRYTQALSTKDEELFKTTMDQSLLRYELRDFREITRLCDIKVELLDTVIVYCYDDAGKPLRDQVKVHVVMRTRYHNVPEAYKQKLKDFEATCECVVLKVDQQWVFKERSNIVSFEYIETMR